MIRLLYPIQLSQLLNLQQNRQQWLRRFEIVQMYSHNKIVGDICQDLDLSKSIHIPTRSVRA